MRRRYSNWYGMMALGVIFIVLALGSCAQPTGADGPDGTASAGDSGPGGGSPPPFDGILVTSSADSGPGSLRQAVADAEPGDEIRFAQDMTILLEGDRRGIQIDKDITISGVGRSIVIQGSGLQRHFTHMPGGPYSLTIANMTLRDGAPSLNPGQLPGGSIYIAGGSSVSIDNVIFESNAGTRGGAIYVEPPSGTASVHILRSDFNDNRAQPAVGGGGVAGGAIYAEDATLVIEDSVFLLNRATGGVTGSDSQTGGAIMLVDGVGTSIVRDSVFRENSAGRYGGAIKTLNSSLSVVDSLFEENRAGGRGTEYIDGPYSGGAIAAVRNTGFGRLDVALSRFVRNRAEGPDNAATDRLFRGGAISAYGQPLRVFSSEFFGNSVRDRGSDGQSASTAANTGAAVSHVATSTIHALLVSGSAFVGNVAEGSGYQAAGPQGSTIAAGGSTGSIGANLTYEISSSSFAQNVGRDSNGTDMHRHFWFGGTGIRIINSTFEDANFVLPHPSSVPQPVVRYVVAPSSAMVAAWPNDNANAAPAFTRSPDPGPDGLWGTEEIWGTDDDYGDLLPLAGSPLVNAGNPSDLPIDVMDLNGNGNLTEPLPYDARGLPRQNGTVDIGAYER